MTQVSFAHRRALVLGILLLIVACGVIALVVGPAQAQDAAKEPAYRNFPWIGSRLAVWAVAQLHLNFAAFILGVPIFAVIIEIIGWRTGESRYDWLSHELVKLTFAAFSTTALLGALLLFLFVGYYPKFWAYMTSIFFPTYWIYALLFFAETFTVYLWYYGWDWLTGSRKWIHVSLGVLLEPLRHRHPVRGQLVGHVHDLAGRHHGIGRAAGERMGGHHQLHVDAHQHPPRDRQRRLRRRSLRPRTPPTASCWPARTRSARTTTGWATSATSWRSVRLLVLPFAGYWLGREIYAFNQTMGITMMGGFMSWLWIIQAFLIGVLFLAANYYLWVGWAAFLARSASRRTPSGCCSC